MKNRDLTAAFLANNFNHHNISATVLHEAGDGRDATVSIDGTDILVSVMPYHEKPFGVYRQSSKAWLGEFSLLTELRTAIVVMRLIRQIEADLTGRELF